MSNTVKSFLIYSALIVGFTLCQGQEKKGTYVDKKGVIRWKTSKEEVQGFGVNYAVPFAHSYRSGKRLGLDLKKAMDDDVYHLSRLGFDLYRCHVWDTEISDTLGNILNNEHLDAFDYLIAELRSHGFNYVLTPIAYWGNGWPEPDENTPGFSKKYGKGNSLTNKEAIAAGQNYLKQFLNHINPYTGLAYKNDPNVVAFEVSNEPHHWGKAADVESFVDGMITSMKSTGTKTPIFYNVSHGVHFAESYYKGGAQGGTFQWYPTGLVYKKELSGNLLPNVDHYDIPFDNIILKNGAAKIVYEFDAADVGSSYIYPAMARSFRTAGIQLATQFAYDATYLGHINTDYNTHYMNLNYTPQKAISLMIAGEVFHKMKRYSSFGKYPDNLKFGDFQIDYNSDLAIYNGDKKYLYTNDTDIAPKEETDLQKIVGYGNSPVIDYAGRGAYFLDKQANGVWRLEVQPDAIWVQDPFGKNSPEKQVAVIKWNEHKMNIKLKELGGDFEIRAINENNIYTTSVEDGAFMAWPGVYLITASGTKSDLSANDAFGYYTLGNYFAPAENVAKGWLIHDDMKRVNSDSDLDFVVEYVGPVEPKSIKAIIQTPGIWEELVLEKSEAYTYKATLAKEKLKEGFLYYDIAVETEETYTYPTNRKGHPYDWDFHSRKRYQAEILNKDQSVYLFNAFEDADYVVKKWLKSIALKPTSKPSESEFQVNVTKLFEKDSESLNTAPIYDYSFKHFIDKEITANTDLLLSKKEVVLKARALNNKPCKFQIALVLDNGVSYGAVVELMPKMMEYRLNLSDLKIVKTVTLPRPYPSFLPYYFEHALDSKFDIARLESIQFSIGPDIPLAQIEGAHGIGVISVYLDQ